MRDVETLRSGTRKKLRCHKKYCQNHWGKLNQTCFHSIEETDKVQKVVMHKDAHDRIVNLNLAEAERCRRWKSKWWCKTRSIRQIAALLLPVRVIFARAAGPMCCMLTLNYTNGMSMKLWPITSWFLQLCSRLKGYLPSSSKELLWTFYWSWCSGIIILCMVM